MLFRSFAFCDRGVLNGSQRVGDVDATLGKTGAEQSHDRAYDLLWRDLEFLDEDALDFDTLFLVHETPGEVSPTRRMTPSILGSLMAVGEGEVLFGGEPAAPSPEQATQAAAREFPEGLALSIHHELGFNFMVEALPVADAKVLTPWNTQGEFDDESGTA